MYPALSDMMGRKSPLDELCDVRKQKHQARGNHGTMVKISLAQLCNVSDIFTCQNEHMYTLRLCRHDGDGTKWEKKLNGEKITVKPTKICISWGCVKWICEIGVEFVALFFSGRLVCRRWRVICTTLSKLRTQRPCDLRWKRARIPTPYSGARITSSGLTGQPCTSAARRGSMIARNVCWKQVHMLNWKSVEKLYIFVLSFLGFVS